MAVRLPTPGTAPMSPPSPKITAARVSLTTAFSLATMKLVVGFITGSLAVISSAIDSLLDILMSGVNLMAIRQAEQPADERHPYGHGKFETLATIFQALAIALSGGWICIEAVRRLQAGSVVEKPLGGIAVMVVSLAASVRHPLPAPGRQSHRLIRPGSRRPAFRHGRLHQPGVAARPGDPVLVRPSLARSGDVAPGRHLHPQGSFQLLRHGLRDVLDEQLPATIRSEIEQLIANHKGELFDYHNLRTRRAGSQKLIDFHLTVCKHLSVDEAHRMTDYLEGQIAERVTGSDVTIHIEPCQLANCPGREQCPAIKIRLQGGKEEG